QCLGGLAERQVPVARERMQGLQGRGADAAARHIDDALESEIVRRLMNEPQIGERVADLLALVEAQAADDAISQAEGQEPLLEFAGLEAGAHQDRHFGELLALALQRLDLVADPARDRKSTRLNS